MRPIIFLDIDGVLNSTRYWRSRNRSLDLGSADALDSGAIRRLNQILKDTNAHVVLSSSWRRAGLLNVETMLKSKGFEYILFAVTPWKDGVPRSAEIEEWLNKALRYVAEHPRVAILDDDTYAYHEDMNPNIHHFVTDYNYGLLEEHVQPIVNWLKGKE